MGLLKGFIFLFLTTSFFFFFFSLCECALVSLPANFSSSEPNPIFVFRSRMEGRLRTARGWRLEMSSSTLTAPPFTAADRKPSSSSRGRTGYWSSQWGGKHAFRQLELYSNCLKGSFWLTEIDVPQSLFFFFSCVDVDSQRWERKEDMIVRSLLGFCLPDTL